MMATKKADKKKTTLKQAGEAGVQSCINPTLGVASHNWEKTQNLELLLKKGKV